MKQVKDSEVLAGLGGYAFIGGDDEQNRVDSSSDACQHIADKNPCDRAHHDTHLVPVEKVREQSQGQSSFSRSRSSSDGRVGARQSGDQG
jgi:hypothetical protein